MKEIRKKLSLRKLGKGLWYVAYDEKDEGQEEHVRDGMEELEAVLEGAKDACAKAMQECAEAMKEEIDQGKGVWVFRIGE